jgi:hypothetical protein
LKTLSGNPSEKGEVGPEREYFEDQPPEMQVAQRNRRREEIWNIGLKFFPIRAEFAGRAVTILGPVDRFLPYKEQATGPEDSNQLMIQPAQGKKFITLASGLTVDGLPLITRTLPSRPKSNPFLGKKVRKSLEDAVRSTPGTVSPTVATAAVSRRKIGV